MPDQIDILTLGGISFDAFSTPDLIPGGGRQALIVHKLPGGARVIDTLGRDDMDIAWRGTFFSNDAMNQALALDSLRVAGRVLPLTYAGQSRQVVIQTFLWSLRRFPMWVEYAITCTVVQQPPGTSGASDSASGIDNSLSSDASNAGNVSTSDGVWGSPPTTTEGGTIGPATAPPL